MNNLLYLIQIRYAAHPAVGRKEGDSISAGRAARSTANEVATHIAPVARRNHRCVSTTAGAHRATYQDRTRVHFIARPVTSDTAEGSGRASVGVALGQRFTLLRSGS